MAATTSDISIANRALQLLGYQSISSLTQNDPGARAINRAYQPTLLNLLRSYYWSFSIKRAVLPASTTSPAFGNMNVYALPPDFLGFAPPDQNSAYVTTGSGTAGLNGVNDWKIENLGAGLQGIVSAMPGPLYLRYISSDVVPSMFDPCFAEAFSALLALNTCEQLTQSNSKMQAVQGLLKAQLDLARRTGARERQPVQAPLDPWIFARN